MRMTQDVLDLDRGVVGQVRELFRNRLNETAGVSRPVEEIGIAKRDVLRTRRDLRPDVVHDHVDRNGAKRPAVDRHDRTVPAQVLAPARGVGRSNDATSSIGHLQRRVTRQRRQTGTIGRDELQSRPGRDWELEVGSWELMPRQRQ
jgi:hypothetical protein